MTRTAFIRGSRMIQTLAAGNRTIMTANTTTIQFTVVNNTDGFPRRYKVASLAIIACRNMIQPFALCRVAVVTIHTNYPCEKFCMVNHYNGGPFGPLRIHVTRCASISCRDMIRSSSTCNTSVVTIPTNSNYLKVVYFARTYRPPRNRAFGMASTAFIRRIDMI